MSKSRADHSTHGQGSPDGGPSESDCLCRGTAYELVCVSAGCGFCGAARNQNYGCPRCGGPPEPAGKCYMNDRPCPDPCHEEPCNCLHEPACHDPVSRACLYTNPVIGPCPCAATQEETRTALKHAYTKLQTMLKEQGLSLRAW
jgi:hypothetical protein